MAPLVLEGANLGKRHQHYNQLLKEAASTNMEKLPKIDYERTDIENLFHIDIANNNKNVEYILEVLRGQDMLYISRAIKRSSWLFHDARYAHIINPEYLHLHLFPQMMPKASCKLLLHIRLELRDESRVNAFFQYFKEKDIITALKWLPHCPLSVIKDAIEKHAKKISTSIFKRLCERSSSVLEIFIKAHDDYKNSYLTAAMFLLRNDTEALLDAFKTCDEYELPQFGKKHTKTVMKKCPERFINNFETFMYKIDLDTFAKYLKREDIKEFVMNQMKNKVVKTWLSQDRINIFIKYMPKEEKNIFVNQFINKTTEIQDDDCCYENVKMMPLCFSYKSANCGTGNSTSYNWYKYASFEVAFADLKKMIRTESNPDERNAMLIILVTTTRRNLKHIHSLLKYYRERHMNEPFRFKVQFVNYFLQKTAPHLYDNKIWIILDEIFRSMEVYVESNNNVQTCIKSIIVYKTTHDEPVPDIIEKKFSFDSLKPFQRKMDQVHKDKVFNYLFNIILKKLNKNTISDNTKFEEYVLLLKNGLDLLKDWKKDLCDFPFLINKLKDCVKIKKEKGWATSLMELYETEKSWKKYIFEHSLVLYPSPEVCMNALKHDPDLLVRYKDEVNELCYNDAVRFERVLGKMRVYWPHTMASEWTTAYRERLDKPGGHKAVVRGIFSLLNQHQMLALLKKYEPHEIKINWADTDEFELSLRKNIAQNMHIARPQVSPEAIMWYAKGDYVQFAQPALNAVLYNLNSNYNRQYVLNLLGGGMTSLQKHGIHLAFTKLSTADIKQIFLDVWTSNKNASVRAIIFQNAHALLCREQDELLIAELWEMIQIFLENLSAEENKIIYKTLGKLDKVPPKIKPAYCTKCYKFLKSLPPKVDCKGVVGKIKREMKDIIDQLDPDFVADIILEFMDKVLLKKMYDYSFRNDMNLLISYLLRASDERIQLQRYEKVFVPFMEKSFSSWDKDNERHYYVKQNFQTVINQLFRYTTDWALKMNYVTPTVLYRNILTKMENSLPATRNYVLFRQLKLVVELSKVMYSHKSNASLSDDLNIEKLHLDIVSDFGNIVVQYFKEDVDLYSPIIYRPFFWALDGLMDSFNIPMSTKIKYLASFLNEKKCVPLYLLIIKMLAIYCDDDLKEDVAKIHEELRSQQAPEVEIYYYKKFGDDSLIGHY